jgi:hypothetical protein
MKTIPDELMARFQAAAGECRINDAYKRKMMIRGKELTPEALAAHKKASDVMDALHAESKALG